jgi:hypothetical protein
LTQAEIDDEEMETINNDEFSIIPVVLRKKKQHPAPDQKPNLMNMRKA